MTSPLYSVGQHVAVCTRDLLFVAPATIVTEVRYDAPGEIMEALDGKLWISGGGYLYRVAAKPGRHWFQEKWLRPINPDTEYLSDSAPQKLEQPV